MTSAGQKSPGDSESSRELDALVDLARRQTVTFSHVALDAGLATVARRLETRRKHRRVALRVAPLAALVLGSILFISHRVWTTAPLSYDVAGGTVLEGGYLREANGAGVTVTFAEGTHFSLAAGARARLRSVDSRGARLALEGGTASWEVVPNADRRWEVEVGPFLVTVKGTAFDVTWDPQTEQFRLDLERGQVLVSGPVSGGELSLQAGQLLVVDLAIGETKIVDRRAALAPPATEGGARGASVPALDATFGQPPPAVNSGSGPGDVATIPTSNPAPSRGWAGAMARGQWNLILRDAEKSGIRTTLDTAAVEELFVLANAARYRQRTALARDALLSLRRRFPRSPRALDAMYLLGRVEESRGAVTAAESWYDEYLALAGHGTYVSEALGRKMTIVGSSLGAARARPLAERYLQSFPTGSYAGAARALLSSP